MDTNDAYFWPGDEELQVWVYIENPSVPTGYVKGALANPDIHQVGVVGDRKDWIKEESLQRMADVLQDDHNFFFLRVVTTTEIE